MLCSPSDNNISTHPSVITQYPTGTAVRQAQTFHTDTQTQLKQYSHRGSAVDNPCNIEGVKRRSESDIRQRLRLSPESR